MDNIDKERGVYAAARLKLQMTAFLKKADIVPLSDERYLEIASTPGEVEPWYDYTYYKNLQRFVDGNIELRGGFVYRAISDTG